MLLFLLACVDPAPVGLEDKAPDRSADPDTDLEVIDPSSSYFDESVMHEVRITLDAADWESLRRQDRSVIEMFSDGCMDAPWPSPFTWFNADVTFDDVALPGSAVRKKGLLGSLSYERPSFRIDTDRNDGGQELGGLSALALNNNNQDPSALRSCLTYAVFREAGVLTPRCALAHVMVNGEDLGLYSHVEQVDPDFIRRGRGEAPESLYEGTLSDFREGWLSTFDAEIDGADGDDLDALADALTVADDALFAALEPLLDLDQFFLFWAAESLTGHWDGYTYNTNNFFVFRDGVDQKLRFVPWGPDGALQIDGEPPWVFTAGILANRLIAHPEGRERYRAALTALVNGPWTDADLVHRALDLANLTDPYRTSDMRGDQNELRNMLEDRAERVLDAMSAEPGPVEAELREASCLSEQGQIELVFSTTWGSLGVEDYYTWGDGSFEIELNGELFSAGELGVVVGEDAGSAIFVAIGEIAPSVYLAPYVTFDPETVAPGVIVLDGLDALGQLIYSEPGTDWTSVAYLGPGELRFTEASTAPNAPVTGTISAPILGW